MPDAADDDFDDTYEAIWHFEMFHGCPLLRDIFGNPLRPIAFDASSLSPTIVQLAQTIYEARAFDRLHSLADSLEQAGCDNAVVLAHLRGPGPHVRGCWALDLILGKE
jgi:hypothetical protein